MSRKSNVYVKELVDVDLSYESFLKELTTKHDVLKSKGVEEIFVEYDSDYSGYVILCGYRLETDEEFKERISRDAKNIENRKNYLKSALINFSKDCPKEFKELMEEI